MKWIEVEVVTNNDAAEAVSEKLMSMGAKGTEMIDALEFSRVLKDNIYIDYVDEDFLDRYGTDIIIKAYFSEDRNPVKLSEELGLFLSGITKYMNIGKGEVKYSLRDDNEWKDVWKQYFKPFYLTDSVVIKPGWEAYSPNEKEIIIEMDPGMAFGTGTHETTKMCAVLGKKHINIGDRVLDLGCGTAILAILSAELGASSVLAADIDDAAVKVARKNIDINNQTDIIEVKQDVLSNLPKESFDLIFINIIADVILDISKDIKDYTNNGSRIILSGIIKDRKPEVKERYIGLGFSLIDEMSMGEWEAMVFSA